MGQSPFFDRKNHRANAKRVVHSLTELERLVHGGSPGGGETHGFHQLSLVSRQTSLAYTVYGYEKNMEQISMQVHAYTVCTIISIEVHSMCLFVAVDLLNPGAFL